MSPLLTMFAGAGIRPFGGASSSGGSSGAGELIGTQTLSSATSQVDFTSIPAGYKHLQLRYVARGTSAVTWGYIQVRFNNDTASNYSFHDIYGGGSSVFSETYSSQPYMSVGIIAQGNNSANIFGAGIVDMLDVFNTNTYKTIRTLSGTYNSSSDRYIQLASGNWRSTSAVSTVSVKPDGSGQFAIGSRFSLYGIKG